MIEDLRAPRRRDELTELVATGARLAPICAALRLRNRARTKRSEFARRAVIDAMVHHLASGKPVVVQHTGASEFLPNGEGLFRFSSVGEAAEAIATKNRLPATVSGRTRHRGDLLRARKGFAQMLEVALR